jgi:hypothetical protein
VKLIEPSGSARKSENRKTLAPLTRRGALTCRELGCGDVRSHAPGC